jgi:hypothetical protein
MRSRVNLCKSIDTRHMFLLAHQILSMRNDIWRDIFEVEPNVNESNTLVILVIRGYLIRKRVKYSLGNLVCI